MKGLPDDHVGDTVILEYQFSGTSLTFYGTATRTRYRVSGGVPFEADALDANEFLTRARRSKRLFEIVEQGEVAGSDAGVANLEAAADEDADTARRLDAVVNLATIKGVGKLTAEKLASANVITVDQVAALSVDELTEITGLSSGKAQSIIDNAAGE